MAVFLHQCRSFANDLGSQLGFDVRSFGKINGLVNEVLLCHIVREVLSVGPRQSHPRTPCRAVRVPSGSGCMWNVHMEMCCILSVFTQETGLTCLKVCASCAPTRLFEN